MKKASSVALVTGASRGLGRAIARSLSAHGAAVVVNYAHSEADAEATVAQCREAGGQAIAICADVCDAGQVGAMVDRIESQWGPVGILVNNATGPQPMRPLEEYSWSDFQQQLGFFVKAPVLLMQRTIGSMKAARSGRVILIGSEVVDLGNAQFSAYVAAKAAMVGLTRAWATEFGPWGITVNLVAPGWIPVERHADVPKEALAAYARGLPLGHLGSPADIGAVVAFLAGSSSGFITGQCLSVNGGNTF